MIKQLVFAIGLAAIGVAGLAGSAVARSGGGHGGHNGAGPGWPTASPSPTPTYTGCVPTLQGNGVVAHDC